MNVDKSIGERLKKGREELGISQKELAEKVGYKSGQTISTIEKGSRSLKASELNKLADAIFKDVNYLLSPTSPKTKPEVLWRKAGSCVIEGNRDYEGYFSQKCGQYYHLEKLLGIERDKQLRQIEIKIRGDERDFDWAEETALAISKSLDLGIRPAASILKVLEQEYGFKIWYFDSIEGLSGASTIGEFGPAILINREEAPWRRNYDLAHELFHIITWEDYWKKVEWFQENENVAKRLETLATCFASSLLLPADELRTELNSKIRDGHVFYQDLVNIAREFEVSIDALLWRSCNLGFFKRDKVLGLLDDENLRGLDKGSKADKWYYPTEFPETFVRYAVTAYQKGELSKGQLARYLETKIPEVETEIAEYGFTLEDYSEREIEVDTRR